MSTSPAARRAREKRARRETILDAAARVFGEKGHAHATMDDVAEVAAVSKGTLYLYFKSKDDLFLALTHRPLEAVLAEFERLVTDDSLPGDALLARLLKAHATVIEAHAPQFRLAMGSLCAGFEPDPTTPSLGVYTERLRAVRRTYTSAIERGMADGSLRAELCPRKVASGLWASIFGATFLRLNGARLAARLPEDDRLDLEELVPLTIELLLHALRSSPMNERPRASESIA